MLLTIGVTLVAVWLCNAVHFFSLRQLAHIFRDFPPPVRRPMLLVSFVILIIHLVEVGIYCAAMGLLAVLDLGTMETMTGEPITSPDEYFYFAIASYTSLGIGDIVPHGHLRIMVGVEALQGLMLIAWTASFTYLVMEKFWARGRQNVLDDI